MTVVHGKRLGWKPDAPKKPGDTPDRRAAALLGSEPPPYSGSARDLVASILNQLALASCTGNAVAQAVRGAQIQAGVAAPPLLSRLWAYYLARAYDHDTGNDDGAQIRNVFAGLVKYGLAPETVWPYDDATSPGAPFSRMPPMEVFRAAFDWRGSYHRIDSLGYERIEDIKRAISGNGDRKKRKLVVFGTDVSEDFCAGKFDPEKPLPPPEGLAIAGGHAIVAETYDGDDFDIVNSWGPEWADGGRCKFSADYLAWRSTTDLWVCDSAPAAAIDGGES